jgi:hypothetical protein
VTTQFEWPTQPYRPLKIQISRALYFTREADVVRGVPNGHLQDLDCLVVALDRVPNDHLVVSLSPDPYDGYGLEFDLTPLDARRMAEELQVLAADCERGDFRRDVRCCRACLHRP